MRRFLTCLFVTLLTTFFVEAQTTNDTTQTPYWIDMMADPTVNFYQTQRAFNLYWQNRTIEKGCGYKPFKRWEYNMSELIDGKGNIPTPGYLEAQVQKYLTLRSLATGYGMGAIGGGTATCQTTGNWVELGPITLPSNRTGQPNGLGRINAVGFHPTDTNIIYVGAPAGGLWVTTDGGQTWSTNTDTLESLGISSIAIDPQHPDTIYLGTGDRDASDSYGQGVFKSTDGGATWKSANSGMGDKTVGKLIIDPNNTNILLAGTSGGVYRSTNGGSSWTLELSGNYKDLVFDAVNSQILYACGSSATLYKSTNNGQSWSQLTSGLPSGKSRMAVAVTPADSNYVYVVVTNSSTFEGLYLSTNRGSSFTQMSDTPNIMDYSHLGTGTGGQAWYDLDIAADPVDKTVVNVCGVNIFQSTNAGRHWTINAHWVGSGGAPAVHADNHVMEYQPGTNTLFTGNDGGVYYTKDLGSSWVDISNGISNAQIYRLGQSATESNTIVNGYQDNGTGYYEKGKWYTVVGGDGMDCVIDPTTATWAYSELYYGDIKRIKDGYSQGTIAKNGVNSITESGGWITPFVLREGTPSTMFVGYKNVWRSTNIQASSISSVSWSKISNSVAGSNSYNITALENSSANSDILYVSRSDYSFFKSTNVNATSPSWTNLSSNLPNNASVVWIESHPTYTDRVWICQSNKIYQSNNGGSSWTNISSGLPNIPVLCLVFDSSSKNQGMYAGTYMGVFYKDTTMSSWQWFNDKMPINTRVRDIEIYHSPSGRSQSHVVCATYGRGNWKSPLFDEDKIKPVAGFTVDNAVFCKGQTVQFTDTTLNTPTAWLWRISPNTAVFTNGTDSNSQNPTVRFDSAGSYTITLFAENCGGLDSVIAVGSIKVPSPIVTAKCTTQTNNKSVNYGIGIFGVEIDKYSFTSKGLYDEGEYIDNTCSEILSLTPDTKYVVKVTTGQYNDEYVKIFIDFNNNGDLADTGELVYSTKTRTNHLDTITIPKSVVLDTFLRMRVISDFSSISSSCNTLNYGQTEDRSVFFQNTATTESIYDTACVSYTWTLNSTTYTSTGSYSHTLKGQNAAGGDSIVTLHLQINESSNSTVSDTACTTYTWSQNSVTYTSSGSYKDTIFGANSVGCDSIITLSLTINDPSVGIDTQYACDTYKWIDGKTYTTNNRTAKFTISNTAGCDSVVTLLLTMYKSTSGVDTQTECDTYKWIDGKTYTASNSSATHTLSNASGCDSVVTLNLTIKKSTTATDVVNACESYKWLNGTTYTSNNSSATYTITNAAGCDSVITLNLTIYNVTSSTQNDTACDTYTWSLNNQTYTSSGSYKDTLAGSNAQGCDSIITLDLVINSSNTGIDSVVACNSYKWIDGKTYTSNNNTAKFTTTNAQGCDSIVSLALEINKSNTGTDVQTACDSYTWIDGKTYTSSNSTATETLTNSSGCDSVVTLKLTIYKSTKSTVADTACDTYTWAQNGRTYTSSGTYVDTLIASNSNGCDSIVTLKLVIFRYSVGTDVQIACDSYKWIDGKTYTASNKTAQYTLTNANGCDSIVTLNLTINESNTGRDIQTACDSYKWIDGNTYTASNSTATYILKNAEGCDSLVLLNLTINKSNTGTDVQVACDSFKWIDGITYTASNNTAKHKLQNAFGCDSIVTLDLTVNKSSSGIDVQVACDTYKWIDGKTYTTSNNTATYILTNTAGCDSIVRLNLSINRYSTGVDKQTSCDSFKWIDANIYTSSNNSAKHKISNSAGCDSFITLDLTINKSSTSSDIQTACDSFTWIDNKTYRTNNATAEFLTSNKQGCDSLITLDLTIINIDKSITIKDPELTANASNVDYQWLDCKTGYSVINGANDQSFTASRNGNYAVEITDNICKDTSECVNVKLATVLNSIAGNSISVYPNPSDGIVTVDLGLLTTSYIVIYDLNGKVLLETTGNDDSIIQLKLDVSPGIYIMEIRNGSIVNRFKLLRR